MNVRYLDWKEGTRRLADRQKLLKRIFSILLVQEDGDVERALEMLKIIGNRYGLFDEDLTFEDFKNLILSEDAEVDSKPSLEIYADDVLCGHGATAGALAEDALFYMRSRGLDQETCTALLIKGFASEILDRVQVRPLQTYLEKLTLRAIPAARAGGRS